jgi:hypothetical protein
MHWMSVKLADNFQIREHSWPCLFHIKVNNLWQILQLKKISHLWRCLTLFLISFYRFRLKSPPFHLQTDRRTWMSPFLFLVNVTQTTGNHVTYACSYFKQPIKVGQAVNRSDPVQQTENCWRPTDRWFKDLEIFLKTVKMLIFIANTFI